MVGLISRDNRVEKPIDDLQDRQCSISECKDYADIATPTLAFCEWHWKKAALVVMRGRTRQLKVMVE